MVLRLISCYGSVMVLVHVKSFSRIKMCLFGSDVFSDNAA